MCNILFGYIYFSNVLKDTFKIYVNLIHVKTTNLYENDLRVILTLLLAQKKNLLKLLQIYIGYKNDESYRYYIYTLLALKYLLVHLHFDPLDDNQDFVMFFFFCLIIIVILRPIKFVFLKRCTCISDQHIIV